MSGSSMAPKLSAEGAVGPLLGEGGVVVADAPRRARRRCAAPGSAAMVGVGSSTSVNLIGIGSCSQPTCSVGIHVQAVAELRVVGDRLRRVHRGDRGVDLDAEGDPLLGASCVLKISRSSARSGRLPRAWSAYFEPGWASNRSARPTPSQKFFQNACSDAMNRTWPSLLS